MYAFYTLGDYAYQRPYLKCKKQFWSMVVDCTLYCLAPRSANSTTLGQELGLDTDPRDDSRIRP